MSDKHQLVQQTLSVNGVALSTLGSRTALNLSAQWTAPESSFLMKRYRYLLQLTGRTLNDDGPVVVLMNPGDTSLAEINNAMLELNQIGPSDTTETLSQDNAWAIYQNTVQPFVYRGDGTEGVTSGEWHSFGGNNGIPNLEDNGMAVHAFNCGSGALTTGVAINGLVQIQGVWLRD